MLVLNVFYICFHNIIGFYRASKVLLGGLEIYCFRNKTVLSKNLSIKQILVLKGQFCMLLLT